MKSLHTVPLPLLLAFTLGPPLHAAAIGSASGGGGAPNATTGVASVVLIAQTAGTVDPDERGRKRDKKRVRATLTESEPDAGAAPEAAAAPDDSGATETAEPDAAAADPSAADATAPRAVSEEDPEPAREATADPDDSDREPARGATPSPALTDDGARPGAPPFAERIEVIEVLLDAIVKKNGRHVTGLGPDDFVVEEEGREVEVTSATYYGTPDELRSSGEGEVERSDRLFILFFHDRSRDAPFLRSLLLDAGQQATRWVEQELLPNDQVAVLVYDVRLKVMSDFTRDRAALTEAISRAVSARNEPDRSGGRSREPLRPAADSPSLLLNLPAGKDLARETRVFELTLALLGRAAEGIVGRKNLMLFSVGFGDVDSFGMWTPDTRYYPQLEQNLNDGNVAVYAIDMVGGRRLGAATPGIASSLTAIADDTNGLYYENFTSFSTPMRQVLEDTQGYYLLSFRSEYPRGTSGYREVRVRMREPGMNVRARTGYLYGDRDPESKRRQDSRE